MQPYIGKFKLELEEMSFPDKTYDQIFRLKYCISLNDIKLFLSKTILEQIFYSSRAIKTYILDNCDKMIDKNINSFNARMNNIYTVEKDIRVEINILGKYFFINVFGGRNATKNDILKAIKKRLNNEKTQIEILRGKM